MLYLLMHMNLTSVLSLAAEGGGKGVPPACGGGGGGGRHAPRGPLETVTNKIIELFFGKQF